MRVPNLNGDGDAPAHRPHGRRPAYLATGLMAAAILGLFGLLRGHAAEAPPDDAGRPQAALEAPDPSGATATANVERVELDTDESWVPDGRVWVRVRNAEEGAVEHVLFGWGDAADRRVQAIAAQPEGGGWHSMAPASARSGSSALFVTAAGCVSVARTDLSVAVRHEVRLASAQQVFATVRDLDSGAPIAGASVCLSQGQCVASEEQGDWIPGSDPLTAIYAGCSDKDGRVALDIPNAVVGVGCHFDAVHPTYIQTALVDDRLTMAAGPAASLNMQQPRVGAITYVGGQIYQARISLVAAHRPEVVPAQVEERLGKLRKRLRPGPETTALALLPYTNPILQNCREVRVDAVLRRGGARADRMAIMPLRDFSGPQLVVCDADAPPIVLAQVRFEASSAFGSCAVPSDLPITISGSDSFSPKRAKLGDVVDLPLGRYRLAFPVGWDGTFAPRTYEVDRPGDHVFQLPWKDGLKMHVLHVVGPPAGQLAQIRVERDQKSFILDATTNRDGDAIFWSVHTLSKADVFVRGFMEQPVVFSPGALPNVFHAECLVDRVRPR